MDVSKLTNKSKEEDGVTILTCPACKGEGPEDYVEANWTKVGDKACCSAYCAAKENGADEEKAQQARAKHTEKAAAGLREQRIDEARAILEAEGEL